MIMHNKETFSVPARVLVLDDDFFTTKLLSYQMRQLGVERVDVCASVDEALNYIGTVKRKYDIIFTDLQMPTADGIEFLRMLAETDYQGRIILFSGEGEDLLSAAQRLAQGFGLMIVAALNKPVSLDELKKSLISGDNLVDGVRSTEQCHIFREKELRCAIEERELVVHYQPQVHVHEPRVTGVEALVRWQRPEGELLMPFDFISQMEQTGLITDMTMLVMEQSFEAMNHWLSLDESLILSVNLSAASLDDLALPDAIEDLANKVGFPLNKLSIELTESQLVANSQYALDVLTRLRLKGVGLSIDDFGTGYSSLIQLDQLPYTELKVDRCFVSSASTNRVGRAIVKSCVELSRQLELTTVAEGVETPEDFQFVKSVGCDLAQGYGIAQPMPAADFVRWRRQWPEQLQQLQCQASAPQGCLAG